MSTSFQMNSKNDTRPLFAANNGMRAWVPSLSRANRSACRALVASRVQNAFTE